MPDLPAAPFHLIGVGGYATSGKDTVGRFLAEDHGYVHTYMSRSLELALLALDPLVPLQMLPGERPWVERYSALHARVGYDESKKNVEVRQLLQRLGTEVGRNLIGEDTWVNATWNAVVRPNLAEGRPVVVAAIRFPNELEAIKDLGGLSIWVDRGLAPVNGHISDNALSGDDFDVTIHNTGTLDDLRAATAKILEGPPDGW